MWKRLPRDARGTSPSRDERTCASTLDVYASGNITRLTATPCGESACNGKRGSGGSGHDNVRPLRLPRLGGLARPRLRHRDHGPDDRDVSRDVLRGRLVGGVEVTIMPCELGALQMLWWSTIAGGSRGLPRRSTPCCVGPRRPFTRVWALAARPPNDSGIKGGA